MAKTAPQTDSAPKTVKTSPGFISRTFSALRGWTAEAIDEIMGVPHENRLNLNPVELGIDAIRVLDKQSGFQATRNGIGNVLKGTWNKLLLK